MLCIANNALKKKHSNSHTKKYCKFAMLIPFPIIQIDARHSQQYNVCKCQTVHFVCSRPCRILISMHTPPFHAGIPKNTLFATAKRCIFIQPSMSHMWYPHARHPQQYIVCNGPTHVFATELVTNAILIMTCTIKRLQLPNITFCVQPSLSHM